MADDIVQTIKIEVEGADQAANEINKVGQATEDVQKTAANTAGSTQELGKGLDQVSQKSGISSRELRSLSKIAKEFGADSAVVGLSLVRMAAVLGPLGAALFAVGVAFASLKSKMKEAEEQTKAITTTFANLAKTAAEMRAENDAAFWGTTAEGMKKAANDADRLADQFRNIASGRKEAIDPLTSAKTESEAFTKVLERAGVPINDVMADTEKLGKASQQAALEAAKIYENLSPIEKLNFEKMLKSLGFPESTIKDIEKGSVALKKIQDDAAKFDASAAGQALREFDTAVKTSQEMVGGWGQTIKIKFAEVVLGWKAIFAGGFGFFGEVLAEAGRNIVQGLGSIGSAIAGAVSAWVTTAASGAWQWIVDTAAGVWEQAKSLAQQAYAAVIQFVTTAPGSAWQWIVGTASSVWEQVKALAQQAWDAVVEVVTAGPGSAWQWIVDTATGVWAQVTTLAGQAYQSIVSFVTTPVASAWQWIVDAWNAMLAKLGFGGGGAAAPADTTGGSFAGGGLLGGRGTGTSDSNLAWVSRGEYVVPARIVRQPGMLALLEALRLSRFAGGGMIGGIPAYAEGGQAGGDKVVSVLDHVMRMIGSIAQAIASTNNAMFDVIRGAQKSLSSVIDSLDKGLEAFSKSIQSILQSTVEASDTLFDFKQAITRRAGGGLLGGRGTGTSDSNLAWVSRGEYVVPAQAVRRPGVLQLLEALRLGGLRSFALGGLAGPMPIPAFAGGGAMNNVTIQFPGLPEITGLRASSAVVDELRKAAAMAQVRSGGRKPSRYS
jgi:hypothetical protein